MHTGGGEVFRPGQMAQHACHGLRDVADADQRDSPRGRLRPHQGGRSPRRGEQGGVPGVGGEGEFPRAGLLDGGQARDAGGAVSLEGSADQVGHGLHGQGWLAHVTPG